MSYFKCAVMALCALALSACDTMPLRANVSIPASLLQQCQPLSKLEGVTGEHLLHNIVVNAEIFNECKDMHNKLVEAVTKDKPPKR